MEVETDANLAARLQKTLVELRAQYDRDVGLLNQRLVRSKADRQTNRRMKTCWVMN